MRHRWLFRFLLLIADVALLEAVFYGVSWWRFKTGMFTNPIMFHPSEWLLPGAIVSVYWVLLLTWFGQYRFDPLHSRAVTAARALKTTAFGILILFILTFDPGDPLPRSRIILASYGVGVLCIIGGNRVVLLTILREFRVQGIGTWSTILVGDGPRAAATWRHVMAHPELGFRVASVVGGTEIASSREVAFPGIHARGRYSEFRSLLRSRVYDIVLFAPEDRHERQLFRMIRMLRESSVRAFVPADLYPVLVGQVRPAHVYRHPLIELRPELLTPVERFMKRATDILLALILLVVTLPASLLISLMISLDSPGGVLYRQRRVGQNGRVFTLLKFRSMRRDAEKATGAVLAAEHDPRVTHAGRVLRRLRLDELPQLVNVLLGHMSLVGPRPERSEFVSEFLRTIPLYARRLNVKPGITGWSQVHLRYDSGADQIPVKLKYDFWYIENMSLPLDMKILFMTLFVMLRGEGQ